MPRESRRLPCGLCGGLFQEDEMTRVCLQDDNLQHFLRRTKTNLSKANARTNGHKKRQPLFLLRGKSTVRPRPMDL